MGPFEPSPVKTEGKRGCGTIHTPQVLISIILITVGVLLFLENTGLIPHYFLRVYWPLGMALWAVVSLRDARSTFGVIWRLTVVAGGVCLTLARLNILHISGGIFWPLILIAIGANMLVSRLRGEHVGHSLPPNMRFHAKSQPFSDDKLNDSAVFGSVNRRVDSNNFQGGELYAVFGGVEIDLRHAAIAAPGGRVEVECNSVFGGMEVRIPEAWRVIMQGAAVFGVFEDKSLPPRPEPGVTPPTLVVRGAAVFGGVTVKN